MTTLTCPKCQGSMRAYERNGITVDQCAECRGIFLDRGELEHLVEADMRAHQPVAAVPAPSRHRGARDHDDDHDDDDRDDDYRDHEHRDGGDRHHGYSKKKRKGSWVDELFG